MAVVIKDTLLVLGLDEIENANRRWSVQSKETSRKNEWFSDCSWISSSTGKAKLVALSHFNYDYAYLSLFGMSEERGELELRATIEVSAATVFSGYLFSPWFIEHMHGHFFLVHDRVTMSILAISEESKVAAALFVADFMRDFEALAMLSDTEGAAASGLKPLGLSGQMRRGLPLRRTTPFARCDEFAVLPDFINVTQTSLLLVNPGGMEYLRQLFGFDEHLLKSKDAMGEDDPFGLDYQATGTYETMKVHGMRIRKTHRERLSGTYNEEPKDFVQSLNVADEEWLPALQSGLGCLTFGNGEAVVSVDIEEGLFWCDTNETALHGVYKEVLVATTRDLYVYLVDVHTLSSLQLHRIEVIPERCFSRRLLGAKFGAGNRITYLENDAEEFVTIELDLKTPKIRCRAKRIGEQEFEDMPEIQLNWRRH